MTSHGRQATLRGVCDGVPQNWGRAIEPCDNKLSLKECYTLRYAKHAVPEINVEQIPPHNATGAYHSS